MIPVDRFADLLTETHRVVHSDFDHEHSIQTSGSVWISKQEK